MNSVISVFKIFVFIRMLFLTLIPARIIASDLVLVLIPGDSGMLRSRYFSRRPTQKSRKWDSRSVEPMIPNEFDLLFAFHENSFWFKCKAQGFVNVDTTLRFLTRSHGILVFLRPYGIPWFPRDPSPQPPWKKFLPDGALSVSFTH